MFNKLLNYLFLLLPLLKFKVLEKSMEPAIREGKEVLVRKFLIGKPQIGDIVVLKNPLREVGRKYIIKRIQKIEGVKFFVIGDNKKESVDSRRFGWIDRDSIIGRVM